MYLSVNCHPPFARWMRKKTRTSIFRGESAQTRRHDCHGSLSLMICPPTSLANWLPASFAAALPASRRSEPVVDRAAPPSGCADGCCPSRSADHGGTDRRTAGLTEGQAAPRRAAPRSSVAPALRPSGEASGRFARTLPAHAAGLYRIGSPSKADDEAEQGVCRLRTPCRASARA